MRECPACLRCYDDSVNQCPDDARPTFNSLPGDLALDGRYLLERRLGEGGMGVVYKAHHKFLKTTRAVKVIKPELVGNDPSFATRFQQEAMAAAAIGHPNIISVPDYGFINGEIPFLVMEFIEGKSLQDLMAEEGRFSPEKTFEYMKVIASAIGAAHANGIVHRDLKPLNIMIHSKGTPSEQIRVLDFGLAKIKSGEMFGSFVGAKTTGIIGSPYYMAPEQWSDEETDKKCDIYSLGIILYQMLSGDVPFKGTSIPAVMKKHLMTAPPPFSETTEGISPELEKVVLHTLEKDPKLRTASCEELIAEMEAAIAGSSTRSRAKGRPKAKTTKASVRRGTAAARTTAEQLKSNPDEEVVVRATADQKDALVVSQSNEPGSIDDGTLLLTEQQSNEIRRSQEVENTVIETTPNSAATLVELHVSAKDLLAKEEVEALPQIVSSGQRSLEGDALQKAAEEARRRAEERAIREASGDLTFATRGTSLPPKPPPVVKHVSAPGSETNHSGADSTGGVSSVFQKPLVLGVGIALLLGLVGVVALIKFWPPSKVDTSVEEHTVPTTPSRDMVLIKGGSFNMGSEGGSDAQRPVHPVSVGSFYLDKSEVTNAEYALFVKAGHAVPTLDENDPSAKGGYWKPWVGSDPPAGWGNYPVCNVSAKDAEEYAEWLSKRDGIKYRLPTEAEWEYAARNGSTNTLFPWGSSWAEGRANLNGRTSPRDVGSFPEGATEAGLLDMIGNVWEWTSSRASYYDQKKVDASEATAYVRRGGSFADRINIHFTNAADRTWYGDEHYKFPTVGFRLARDAQ